MSAPSSTSRATSRMASMALAGSIWYARRSPNCGVESAASGVLFCGQAEQEHGGDAHGRRVLALLQQLVHREAALPRHGADGLAHSAAMGHEERVDEIIHLEVGLADHLAQERQLAETTGSVQGRRHG